MRSHDSLAPRRGLDAALGFLMSRREEHVQQRMKEAATQHAAAWAASQASAVTAAGGQDLRADQVTYTHSTADASAMSSQQHTHPKVVL